MVIVGCCWLMVKTSQVLKANLDNIGRSLTKICTQHQHMLYMVPPLLMALKQSSLSVCLQYDVTNHMHIRQERSS